MEKKLKEYIASICDKSKNTLDAYKRDLSHFYEYMVNRRTNVISEEDIAFYVLELEKSGLSKATINRKISVIGSFYDFVKKSSPIKDIDFAKYKKKREKKELELLKKSEFDMMIGFMDISKPRELRDKIIILLMYYIGLKPTTIANIKKDDIDFSVGILKVDGKFVSLKQDIVTNIKAYVTMSENDEEVLFLNNQKQKLSRQAIWKIVKKYAERVDITKEINSNVLHQSYKLHKLM